MFNSLFRTSLIAILLFFTGYVQATVVEAEGRAIIENNDLAAAREAAILDATQQASMHAAVFISSNQVVRDGILEIDNMEISTLGQVSNIQVLDEKVIGNILHVRIIADVLIDTGCKNGVTNKYVKSLALAAFPLENLGQAKLGNLHDAPLAFPRQLTQLFNQSKTLTALNAGRINFYPDPSLAATSQLSDGALSSMLSNIKKMDVNYVVSGVIKDMSIVDPSTYNEDNYFVDLYNRSKYLNQKPLRNLRAFTIDLFVHDGFSGNLVMQKSYQTAGLWDLDPSIKTGFSSTSFAQEDYGQKIQELQQQIVNDLTENLLCEPFTARITNSQDKTIWISAGSAQGVKIGDKLTVYRRSTFYTPDMRPQTQLMNTQQTLVIKDVQNSFASGQIKGAVEQFNIRPGDLVIAN
ncbi:MAG: hypothetical protein GY843_06020 [Neptuniibacter sp.]|nr:hypothetical protein [Neptuniibacter sp.]